MTDYIVYKENGEIVKTGFCDPSTFELQAGENEYVMQGTADDAIHMIVDGQIVEKPEPEPLTNQELQQLFQKKLRAQRNYLLEVTDWTQVNDIPFSDAKKLEWQNYRQQLRDLPSQYQSTTDIDDVVYPTMPE